MSIRTGGQDETSLRTYGPDHVPALLDTVADIWAEAHPELATGTGTGPGDLSEPALRRQITGHTRHGGCTLVVAHEGGTPVGMGYAFPCSASYWFGPDLLDRVPGPRAPSG
jgi:hypothetical protein